MDHQEDRLPIISIDVQNAVLRSDSYLREENKETIKNAEIRYKRFLFLIMKYPNSDLSPSKDIDEIWHLHMLHPVAYNNDCYRLFSEILDHDGGFGKESEEQHKELELLFDKTSKLWEKEYKEPYVKNGKFDIKNCRRACRVACKVEKKKKILKIYTDWKSS